MVKIDRFSSFAVFLPLLHPVAAAGNGWNFVQNGTTGIVALESIIVSDTLALFFDRATNDSLQIDGHTAWAALYNLETNTPSPLRSITDSFCGSGGFLSNGTMVIFSLSLTADNLHKIGQCCWTLGRNTGGRGWAHELTNL